MSSTSDTTTTPAGLRLDRPAPGVVTVSFTGPGRLNALSSEMITGLPVLLDGLASDSGVGAVVLTGDGGAFSAGADLAVLAGEAWSTAALVDAFRAVTCLRRMPQPVIAAVDGPAAGGAFGLALACDIRLASPRAFFCATFIEMGLLPDYGLTTTLPRIVGASAALEILLTGRRVPAAEARDLGLVLRVVEDPLAEAVALAAAVAARPHRAVAGTKRLVHRGLEEDLEACLRAEAESQVAALTGPEFRTHFARWRDLITARE